MTSAYDELTPKQQDVLEKLLIFSSENQYPPSIQQLCGLCGVSSTSTIHFHLSALRKKGFIDWNPASKRAISIRDDIRMQWEETHSENTKPSKTSATNEFSKPKIETSIRDGIVPFLGSIAAGSPLQTIADSVEKLDLTSDLCPPGCYALRVRGVSMIEDHIMDEDIVIINPQARIREGDVVVALLDGETATLKRFYKEKDRIRLQPANASMEPIYVKEVNFQGKVEAVLRRY
jgi:repressor LexA